MNVVAVTGLAFEARIAAGPGVRTLAAGGDPRRLVLALDGERAHGIVAIMSFGIAAGLQPEATPGTCVVAERVVTASGHWISDAGWAEALAQQLPGAIHGAVAGTDAIVATPAAKQLVAQATGAFALDMESHVVAAFAHAHGIPFAVFRVVADPVARTLAPAATQGMRSDGTVDGRAVARSLLRTPLQMPMLLRNALDTRAAVRALSRGRRLLGPGLSYPDFR